MDQCASTPHRRNVCMPTMGVDHGGGEASPPKFGVGDANANCPPQILSYRYKKERSVAFKICQNPFSAPDPAGGAHDSPPGPLVG